MKTHPTVSSLGSNQGPSIEPCSRARARRLAPVLAALAVAALASGCVPHQTGGNQVPEINQAVTAVKDAGFGSMPAGVDAAVAAYLSTEGAPPGCAIGIMQNNSIAYLKGYGSADLANAVPYTHTHAAVVGSVSKTWTALAVLRLMEMGYLDLDDPISTHLPIPAAWAGITIRQLLSHTSGLQRDPTFHPALNTELELSQFLFPFLPMPIPRLGIHPTYVYYSYQQTPVVGFAPGATAEYSNTGYMILGALIDGIASEHADAIGESFTSYEGFVWRQVGFFDGNLNNGRQMLTQCLNEYWRQTDIPELARGYSYDGADYIETTFSNSSLLQLGPAGWEGPPGGWTMTIGDLVRLMMAIENNDIISGTTRDNEMMQSYGQTVDGNGNVNGDWGLGVSFASKLGRPVYLHDGKYPGYRARYTVWPGENFGVAIMANESDADMRSITDAVAAVFIGSSPSGRGVNPGAVGLADTSGPGIDDDDPGIGGEVGRDGPVPDLTDRERRAAWAAQVQSDRHQLANQHLRAEIEARLEESGCLRIVERLLAEHGVSLAAEFARCFDSATHQGECVSAGAKLLNGLLKEGRISPRDRGELQRCVVQLAQAWRIRTD